MATQDDNNSWEHIGEPLARILERLEKQRPQSKAQLSGKMGPSKTNGKHQ